MLRPDLLQAGGMALVDYGGDMAKERLLRVQEGQAQAQQARVALEAQEAARKAARDQEMQAALSEAQGSTDPGALAKVMMRFPEASEALSRAFKVQDEGKRRVDLSQAAQIYSAAKSGRYDIAAEAYQRRLEADEAAGGETDQMETAILEGLRSGDTQQQQYALSSLGVMLSAMTGEDHFSSTLERIEINRDPKIEVIDNVAVDMNPNSPTYRQEVYDSPYPRIVPGPEGSFFRRTRDGGGVASPPPGQAAPSSQPSIQAASNLGQRFGTVTSTLRSPGRNKAVGGAPNSFHLSGRAIDIARKPGVSHAQIEQAYRQAGFQIVESLDEGDHSHFAFAGGAAQVKSKQQYDALPKGARYIAPDGSERVKG